MNCHQCQQPAQYGSYMRCDICREPFCSLECYREHAPTHGISACVEELGTRNISIDPFIAIAVIALIGMLTIVLMTWPVAGLR